MRKILVSKRLARKGIQRNNHNHRKSRAEAATNERPAAAIDCREATNRLRAPLVVETARELDAVIVLPL